MLSPTAASVQQARHALQAEQLPDGDASADAAASELSGAKDLQSALSSLNESTFETAQACEHALFPSYTRMPARQPAVA